MKKTSIEKLLQVHRDIYGEDKKALIEEVLIAECGEEELKQATK